MPRSVDGSVRRVTEMTPSHDGYACRQILGRDLVKGLGEEVDLRGFSALLDELRAHGCGAVRDQAAIAETVPRGQPADYPACPPSLSLHHPRCQ